MEDNFYNDDGFEEFLQRQVKDHRLYPSDGIWRNIYKKLHGDTNWPALTIAAFTLLGIIIAFSFYFSPSPDILSGYSAEAFKIHAGKPSASSKSNDLVSTRNGRKFGKGPIPYVNNAGEETAEKVQDVVISPDQNFQPDPENIYLEDPAATNATTDNHVLKNKPLFGYKKDDNYLVPLSPLAEMSLNAAGNIAKTEEIATEDKTGISVAGKSPENAALKMFGQNFPNSTLGDVHEQTAGLKKVHTNKFSYLVYISPSRSYRRLTQNTYFNKTAGPLAINYLVDVNKVARYNPGTGVEAGVSFMYNITDKLKVGTGLQFNIRQYSLEAFIAPADMSTIALTNRSGGAADTINSYAVYRNSNGYLSTELVNRYYEVSLPIGLQWEIIGNRVIQLNVAASVQPTYLMNKNAYLLSTDFKNYTINPGLMHSWNINTNLEAFVTIKSGDFKWQLGPQFRYQNLPTFISKYPIRENLIDYGFKIGVSKNLK